MDLRKDKPAPKPVVKADTGEKMKERQAAMLAEQQAAAAIDLELPEQMKPDAAKPLADRRMKFPVTYTNPDTGVESEIELISCVPDETEVDTIHADIRRRLRNAPWDSVPEWMKLRAIALATCWVQIKQAPDWFMERIGEDGKLLFDTYGRLAEHSAIYFPGDESQGTAGQTKPRLAVGPLSSLSSPVRGRRT